MYDPEDPKSLEKYSSAVTLSDMEVFIFPDLLFSLVLANMMSPKLWGWLADPWFDKRDKLNEYRRILRVKQYIMDHFVFNLDLDTWGLTTKQRELARFSGYVDEQILAQSNALFGYEGDRYYFDIDIRRHFGLDKYTSDVIPYWKTETLEAMEAFRHKEAYGTGAGECVSLSTLYASALAVVGGVPLERIYLMATPLHSQNFIDIKDGLITNNRRIVTKAMWFNGSEISAKARRAIEHEKVTVVADHTGYIHTLYPDATIDPERYRYFSRRLREYLKTEITYALIAAFLRDRSELQRCFQVVHSCCGKPRYIEAEKVFAYEHNSKSKMGDETQNLLLHEIDEDDFYPDPLPNRILLSEAESFFLQNKVSVDSSCKIEKLKNYLRHSCFNVDEVIRDLLAFARIEPRLPDQNRRWTASQPITLDGARCHEEVIAQVEAQRGRSDTADLAFTAYRDMKRAPWKPFLKAAFERNPVCVEGAREIDVAQTAQRLLSMDGVSIYDGTRMAQPDEVWNYGRGDGLEKALCLAVVARAKLPGDAVTVDGDRESVRVRAGGAEYLFRSDKGLDPPPAADFPR